MAPETKLSSILAFFTFALACSSSTPSTDGPSTPLAGTNAGGAGSPSGGGNVSGGAAGSVAGAASGGGGASGSAGGGAGIGGAGGAGGSAGASGGGSSGSGRSCASGQFLLSEDFEQTAVGEIPTGWTRRGPTDKVGVADDSAKGGRHSLRLGAMENGERRIARSGAVLGAAHWGRVHFKVQLPVTDAFVHSTLVAGFGVGPTKGDVEVRLLDTVKAQRRTRPAGAATSR